jgi:hypothetical protein
MSHYGILSHHNCTPPSYTVALKIDRTPHAKINENCAVKNFEFHLFERENLFLKYLNQVKLGSQ